MLALLPLIGTLWLGSPEIPTTCEGYVEAFEQRVKAERSYPLSVAGTRFGPSVEDDEEDRCDSLPKLLSALAATKDTPGEVEDFQRGTVARLPAGTLLSGPYGSGRYWNMTVAVRTEDGVFGGCLRAATLAWRGIHKFSEKAPRWVALQDDALIVWRSVGGSAENPSSAVLFPVAFRLQGTKLTPSMDATRLASRAFLAVYEASAQSKEPHRLQERHRAAATAFAHFSKNEECPAPE